MWIKAVYCTDDETYAERLVRYFDSEYENKIELNVCASMDSAIEYIDQYHADIALFGDEYKQEVYRRFKEISCTYVFLTDQEYERPYNELEAKSVQISKYQRADKIYRSIITEYSSGNKVKRIDNSEYDGGRCKIYVFTSASGGSGVSTIAKAYARRYAYDEKVLYLSLGLFDYVETVEDGANANGLDDVVLALKSRRNILAYKLTGAVYATADGTYSYGICKNAIDLLELGAEEGRRLMDGFTALSEYQKIIIDIGSSIAYKEIEFMKKADTIIYVADESDIGQRKLERFWKLMENVGRREKMNLSKRVCIFKNKVRHKPDEYGENSSNVRLAGWAPCISADSYDAVIDKIAQSVSFNGLEIRDGN